MTHLLLNFYLIEVQRLSMINESGANRNSKIVLPQHLQHALYELENEMELFENLLKSYPRR